ncbi:hypothetical protein [Ferroplasma acidiphilum]|uniref:hypothetical protein n=1 Tax=Ferroplasma acidiphilum TaxID=74969 RepID=UPI002814A799|nr:hypothetical protein [Ferroplasma acidiphilum]WMT54115.1 MAG: hypothetical protein RE473_04500 [Ferroplasma acidiphilum]
MAKKNLTEEEKQKLRELLAKTEPEELRNLMEEEKIPRFEWNSNLIAFKQVMRKVLQEPGIKDERLVKYLIDRGLLTKNANVDNYGYVYTETNLFRIENKNKIYLTNIGKTIAELFNDEEDLTILEIVIMRGLQVQGAGFTMLHLITMRGDTGVFREDLENKMKEYYGGKGTYFLGYYVRVFKQLNLIEKITENGKAKYIPKFPVAWSNNKVPSKPDDED